jgi:hypothetical protein
MAEYHDREHYIPLRKSDLVELLYNDRGMERPAADSFRRLSELISATFHYEYYKLLEELKDEYAPFDPDSVTKPLKALTSEQKAKKLERLFERLVHLMERANFVRLGKEALDAATKEVSAWGVNMDIDLSIFEKLEIFARGDTLGTRYLRNWKRFGKRESVQVPLYQRLVLFVKLKPSKRLPPEIDTDDVVLKAFKDIPKADLEMLLPGAQLKMPGLHRLKLGSSVVSGGAWMGYSVFKQAGTLLLSLENPALIAGPALGLFGYGYKQYYGYQSTRNVFHLRLTQSLYYHALGNNLAVLFHLLDEAEEQECREALLAYYYLWRHAGANGWLAKDLDDYVEMDLERLTNLKVDFEIEDAVAKLVRLKLVTTNGDKYVAVPIEKALEALDYAWDNYFSYNSRG